MLFNLIGKTNFRFFAMGVVAIAIFMAIVGLYGLGYKAGHARCMLAHQQALHEAQGRVNKVDRDARLLEAQRLVATQANFEAAQAVLAGDRGADNACLDPDGVLRIRKATGSGAGSRGSAGIGSG